MTKLFVDIFGYLAEDRVAQAVINDTFQAPVDTPKYVLEFLETLVMLDAIRELGPVDLTTSYEENRTGLDNKIIYRIRANHTKFWIM